MHAKTPLPLRATLGSLTLALVAATAVAGTELSFPDARNYTDAGDGMVEIERTQRVLGRHMSELAAQLPDGHDLRITVLDVDLAGEVESFWPVRVRVMGRVPDGPRLTLRYELRHGEQVLASGEDMLRDPGYLWRSSRWNEQGALVHERRLLQEWFDARIAPVAVR